MPFLVGTFVPWEWGAVGLSPGASPEPHLPGDIAPGRAGPGRRQMETNPQSFGAWAAGPAGQGRGAAAPKSSWYLFRAPGRRILPSCHPENEV